MKRLTAKYRPPAAWLYWPVAALTWLLFSVFLGVRIRRDPKISRIRGPLLILGNHPSYLDPFYMAMALFPRRIHFLTSRGFFRYRLSGALLRQIAAIPKIQFRSDQQALKDMFRVIRSGGNLAIYPEGQRSLDGSCQMIDEAIAKLVKKLACPVVVVHVEGGYLTWPRWSKSALRPGRVEVRTRYLFSPAELYDMDVPAIQAAVLSALNYQDYGWQNKRRHAFRSLAPARGLHNLCHQCPACGRDLAMQSTRFHLTCRCCGNKARLNRFGQFQKTGARTSPTAISEFLPNPYEWHQWQLNKMSDRVKQPDFRLEFPAAAELLSDEGTVRPAGHGKLLLSQEFLEFKSDPADSAKALVDHPALQLKFSVRNQAGLNADYGWRFELVLADQAYRFIPDEGQAVVLLADAISALQKST